MRQSREELIKRGVLKEIYDKGKGTGPPSAAWNLGACFLELDTVFCITLSGLEPVKLQTVLERKEKVADGDKAVSIIWGWGHSPLVLSIGIKPQDAKKNDMAPGVMRVRLVSLLVFQYTQLA